MEKVSEADLAKRIKAFVLNDNYAGALSVVKGVDTGRIKNPPILCTIGEVYMHEKQYEAAEEVFLRAYERSPKNRRILDLITSLYIEMGEYSEAEYYYKEFISVASRDLHRYILRYRLDKGKGERLSVLIDTLERLKDYEYVEEWAYELATLYEAAGEEKKCIHECDEIVLWFGHGEYVDKAIALKCRLTGEPLPATTTVEMELERMAAMKAESDEEMEAQIDVWEAEEQAEQPAAEEAASLENVSLEEVSSEDSLEENDDIVINPYGKTDGDAIEEAIDTDLIEKAMGSNQYEFYSHTRTLNDGSQVLVEIPEEDDEDEDEIISDSEGSMADFDDIFNEAKDELSSLIDEMPESEMIEEDLDDEDDEDEVVVEITNEDQEFLSELFDEDEDDEDEIISADAVIPQTVKNIFATVPDVKDVHKQLAMTLSQFETSSNDYDVLAPYDINFVVLSGDKGMKSQIALGIAKALNTYGICDKNKIVRAKAKELNQHDFSVIFDKISGGCLIIERADELSDESVAIIEKVVNKDTQDVAIVLESRQEDLKAFWKRHMQLRGKFLNVINVSKYNEMELVTLAKGYFEKKGYELSQEGAIVLRDIFKEKSQEEDGFGYEHVMAVADAAIANLEKRNMKNLFMTVLDNKYEEAEMMKLLPEDFKGI